MEGLNHTIGNLKITGRDDENLEEKVSDHETGKRTFGVCCSDPSSFQRLGLLAAPLTCRIRPPKPAAQAPPRRKQEPMIVTSDKTDTNVALCTIFSGANVVALDLEGVDLGRLGRTSIVQIATEEHCLLLDVLDADKDAPLMKWLRDILEDSSITKVIHDCRLASDALLHEFGIRLDGVHDTAAWHVTMTGRAEVNINETLTHNGIGVLYHHRNGSDYRNSRTNHAFWATRPLTPEMVAWAAGDASSTFKLYAAQRTAYGTIHIAKKKLAEKLSAKYLKWAREAKVTVISVKSSVVGRFIGRGGSNLRDIQKTTATLIKPHGSRLFERKFAVYYYDEEGLTRVRGAASGELVCDRYGRFDRTNGGRVAKVEGRRRGRNKHGK
jgi:hypothetical protein